ncbi:Serpentine receptor class gamma [Meloidogyne graminicola]|uniref:Serpentine receptor class gamma n=1 Tax=Meloidogyne graminicola TaxID=189291 RepID=A0A8T0A1S3_9BILA|nr:Serpentine receptor class gamma [Meloidogyne graminicola]
MVLQIFVWLSSLSKQFLYLSIAANIPSLILYILEIITILKHKQFHNPFFILVLIRAVPNIVYSFDTYFANRLTFLFGDWLYPLYRGLPEWTFRISFFIVYFTMMSDFLATIIILINRWTAVEMALKYDRLWKKLMIPSTLIIFIIPTILYAQVLTIKCYLKNDTSDPTKFAFFLAQEFNPIYDAIPLNFYFCIIFMIICFIINIGTFISYRIQRKKNTVSRSTQQINHERTEFKLILYAFLTFMGHVVLAINQVIIFLVASNNGFDLNAIYTQSRGSVIVPSWLLFWASDKLRKKLINDFWTKWINKITNRIHVTSDTTLVASSRNVQRAQLTVRVGPSGERTIPQQIINT